MLRSSFFRIVAAIVVLGGESCERAPAPKTVDFTTGGESSVNAEYPRLSKKWWIHELQTNRDKLVSDISRGTYSDQDLVEVILLNRDKGLLDLEIAPLAMDAWLKHWNPVGKSKDDLIKQLGAPDRLDQDLILYEFTESGGAGYIFILKDGRIVSWRREDAGAYYRWPEFSVFS